MPNSTWALRVILLVSLGLVGAFIFATYWPSNYLQAFLNHPVVSLIGFFSALLTSATALLIVLAAWEILASRAEYALLSNPNLHQVYRRCRGQFWMRELMLSAKQRDFLLLFHQRLCLAGLVDTPLRSILTPGQFYQTKPVGAGQVRDIVEECVELAFGSSNAGDFKLTLTVLTNARTGLLDLRSLRAIQLGILIRAGYRPRSEDLDYLWSYVLSILPEYNSMYPVEWTESDKESMLSIWLGVLPTSVRSYWEGPLVQESTLRNIRSILRNQLLIRRNNNV